MLLSHINTEWFVVAFALKNKAGFSLETEREARAKVSGSHTTQTGGRWRSYIILFFQFGCFGPVFSAHLQCHPVPCSWQQKPRVINEWAFHHWSSWMWPEPISIHRGGLWAPFISAVAHYFLLSQEKINKTGHGMLLMVPPNEFLNCPSLPGTTVKHPLMTLSRASIGVHSPMEGKQGSERDPIFCFTKPHIYFNEQIHMFLIRRLPWHCNPSVCVLKEAYLLARTSFCFRESDAKVGMASKHVPTHRPLLQATRRRNLSFCSAPSELVPRFLCYLYWGNNHCKCW